MKNVKKNLSKALLSKSFSNLHAIKGGNRTDLVYNDPNTKTEMVYNDPNATR